MPTISKYNDVSTNINNGDDNVSISSNILNGCSKTAGICSICLMVVDLKINNVWVTKCCHVFHAKCMCVHLHKQRQRLVDETCPLCKANITDDIEFDTNNGPPNTHNTNQPAFNDDDDDDEDDDDNGNGNNNGNNGFESEDDVDSIVEETMRIDFKGTLKRVNIVATLCGDFAFVAESCNYEDEFNIYKTDTNEVYLYLFNGYAEILNKNEVYETAIKHYLNETDEEKKEIIYKELELIHQTIDT